MALKNNHLINARNSKNDEFYTQYKDIEEEVSKFKSSFNGKIVYCPCDSCNSKFPQYFKDKFKELGLKGLYRSAINDDAFYYDGNEEIRIDGIVDITKQSFIDLMLKCDIVVTNPPFSLFREFLDNIINNKKQFLIIGQQNTISCKSVFTHIMDGELTLDYGFNGIAGWFEVPSEYEDYAVAGEHKVGMIRVSGVIWYTNLPIEKEVPFIKLKKRYYNEDGSINTYYKTYDNFREISGLDEDCININKVSDIPCDYYGYMGVPISFFGKYNPRQFELIQLDHYGPLGNQDNVVDGVAKYRRIYVKQIKKEYE